MRTKTFVAADAVFLFPFMLGKRNDVAGKKNRKRKRP